MQRDYALIKQDKFEWMLQKACELGVSKIVPFVSKNTVVKLDEKKAEKKLIRWNEILLAATKQCNRNTTMKFDIEPATLSHLPSAPSSPVFLPAIYPDHTRKLYVQRLSNAPLT